MYRSLFTLLFLTGIAAAEEVKTFSYGEHARQVLDVSSPRNAKKAPVVIFFHGGGWMTGEKEKFWYVPQRLVDEGIVAVSAEYRLFPDVKFPEFVKDGADVVAWTKNHIAQYGGDPERIYLMGHSAGAHTVAMLGLDESYLENVGVKRSSIKGVIAIAAPFMVKASQLPSFLKDVFGTAKDEEMCPLCFIDGQEPPFLLLQGGKDILVQPIHSQVTEKMIREKGGKVTAYYFPEHDHMSIVGAFSPRLEKMGNIMKPIMAMISAK